MIKQYKLSIVLVLIVGLLALVPNGDATGYMDGGTWTGIDNIYDSLGMSYLKNNSIFVNNTQSNSLGLIPYKTNAFMSSEAGYFGRNIINSGIGSRGNATLAAEINIADNSGYVGDGVSGYFGATSNSTGTLWALNPLVTTGSNFSGRVRAVEIDLDKYNTTNTDMTGLSIFGVGYGGIDRAAQFGRSDGGSSYYIHGLIMSNVANGIRISPHSVTNYSNYSIYGTDPTGSTNLWGIRNDGSPSFNTSAFAVVAVGNGSGNVMTAYTAYNNYVSNDYNKIISYDAYGRDSVGAKKQVYRTTIVPIDTNYVYSVVRFWNRYNDTLVNGLSLTGNGNATLSGSMSITGNINNVNISNGEGGFTFTNGTNDIAVGSINRKHWFKSGILTDLSLDAEQVGSINISVYNNATSCLQYITLSSSQSNTISGLSCSYNAGDVMNFSVISNTGIKQVAVGAKYTKTS